MSQATTAADYSTACTLVENDAVRVKYKVANASVFAQLMPINVHGGDAVWGPEFLITPEDGGFGAAQGIRFRDAVAGTHAQVVAQAFAEDDPQSEGAVAFLSTINSQGQISTVTNPGHELDYQQITAPTANVTATTEGTSVAQITGNSVTYDGTRVKVEFFCPFFTGTGTGGDTGTLVFYRDGTAIGQSVLGPANTAGPESYAACFDTPPAGPHTYKVALFVTTGVGHGISIGAGTGLAGTKLPATLRVTTA